MTDSTRPTLPQDFPIEVAENEGMPPGPGFKGSSPPNAPIRRVTGTLTLGLSKTRAATDCLRSAKEVPMRQNEVPPTRPLARLLARTTVAAGVIASMAFPVFAQDGTGSLPDNVEPAAISPTCSPMPSANVALSLGWFPDISTILLKISMDTLA